MELDLQSDERAKSIAIIGAGIAGLAVGCYAQMNGYRTRIFEAQDRPGGLCTTWKRQGYNFDGCLQWLVGSGPGSDFYRGWQELGALDGKQIVDHEEFTRVVGPDGKALILYTDVDRLERHMRELAPEDADRIGEFTDLIRACAHIDLPLGKPRELMSAVDTVVMFGKMLPAIWTFARYGKLSLRDFAARFQDPFLRTALAAPFDLPDFPLIAATLTLAWMNKRTA